MKHLITIYRLFNPNTKRILRARDVVFDENIFQKSDIIQISEDPEIQDEIISNKVNINLTNIKEHEENEQPKESVTDVIHEEDSDSTDEIAHLPSPEPRRYQTR